MLEADIGNRPGAETAARDVLAHDTRPMCRSSAQLASAGARRLPAEAAAAVREMTPRYPASTMMKQIYLPMAAGAAALGERRPDRAVEALRPAAPYDFGFVASLSTAYLRGQAHLMKGAEPTRRASSRASSITAARPVLRPDSAVAPRPRARVRQAGRPAKQQAAYQAFFDLWKDADADIPVLAAARREAAALGHID